MSDVTIPEDVAAEAVAKERARLALVVDQIAVDRQKQAAGAKVHGLRDAARDFQTMSMQARQIAQAIRSSHD